MRLLSGLKKQRWPHLQGQSISFLRRTKQGGEEAARVEGLGRKEIRKTGKQEGEGSTFRPNTALVFQTNMGPYRLPEEKPSSPK